MNAKKILIITYYWPPSGGVGVQRWMNFAIQLKKRGWDPVIYTPENPQFEIIDPKLTNRVKNIKVVRQSIWEPFNLFHVFTGQKERKHIKQGLVLEKAQKSLTDKLFVWIRGNIFLPDARIFWVRRSVKFLKKIIPEEEIKIIITTGPPHSMHLIGRGVKKSLRVRWLADFRDPWSKWDILEKLKTSALARMIHERLETQIMKSADIITTVSKRLARSFEDDHHIPVNVVHNGISLCQQTGSAPPPQYFTIGYFGMLNELRNPVELWQALEQLCCQDDNFDHKLRIMLGGIISENVREELESNKKLKEKISYMGYMPHEQVVSAYFDCNLLLLLLNKSDNAKWILPLKFFEYLGANRKILALGLPNSDLGDLMNGKSLGKLMEYSDIEGIKDFISNEYEKKDSPDRENRHQLIAQFSHSNLTDKLEDLLNKVR